MFHAENKKKLFMIKTNRSATLITIKLKPAEATRTVNLLNNEDSVIELLSVQERVKVSEQGSQVHATVTVGNYDGETVTGNTVTGLPVSTR